MSATSGEDMVVVAGMVEGGRRVALVMEGGVREIR